MLTSFPVRLAKLLVGLVIYGIGVGLTVQAGIGLAPWDVLAQGIAKQTALSFGWATVTVSIMVLLLWIPLKVKPGLGSILNALMIGLVADATMHVVTAPEDYLLRLGLFIFGMAVISFATGMYISCGMGKGPRDGLNVGIAQKFKRPFWQARTFVEVSVVTAGFLLGGQVREGTLIFALLIGYMNQLGMRLFKLVDKTGRM